MKKAVFLDRDGTLNPDPGYINDPAMFEFFQGVPEALRDLKKAGFLLVVVTNQSGIARNLILPDNLARIHEKMAKTLADAGAELAGIYHCPHLPEAGCSCRKPSPGMILQAIRDLDIDPRASYMIGDKDIDAEMGMAGGVTPVLVGNREVPHLDQVYRAADLREAVDWILSRRDS